MKRTVQSVLMLVALWGALLTIALREGWDMPRWLNPNPTERPMEPGRDAPVPPVQAPAADPPSDVANAAKNATPNPEAEADDTPTPSARYRVCASDGPVMSLLQLDDHAQALGVHCGARVDVIHLNEQAEPTRIAMLNLPSANPSERFKPTAIISADANADGMNDLLLPLLTVDAWGHPVGRHVLLIARDSDGGFRPATRVAAASPLAVVAGVLDAQPGVDFAVLHATNESVKKPREAWWFSGGAMPRRFATTPLSARTEQLAWIDLDRDNQLDLIALSPAEARIDVVFGAAEGTTRTTLPIEVSGCAELLLADLNGDAHDDVLCVGEQSRLIEARADRELQGRTISLAGERVRSLQTADLNADGKLDLVGYAHPQLVRLERASEDRFEPRLITELRGSTFSPLAVLIVDLNGDGALDLVMLGNSRSDPNATDLVILHDISKSALFSVQAEAIAIADAPLLLRPSLQ